MHISLKISLFLILLVLSNIYLFKSGYWFAQDTSYWPKNDLESFTMISQQLHVFSNFGYYLGFDQGLFNFTRIGVVGAITSLQHLVGFEGSQLIFTLSGYILTFFSFYLFSGIFFKNNNNRYLLSLLYTFNPLSYTLQGYVFYNAAVPLFLYAYHQYFYVQKNVRVAFLLLSIFAAYIWVAYIRFVQSNFFVIFPYCLYFFFYYKRQFVAKKVVVFIVSYLLLFLPTIYSFASQLFEKSQTAFFYGEVFRKFVPKDHMYNAFNIFQTIGVTLYEYPIWTIIGLGFFLAILRFLITLPKEKYSGLLVLNLGLVLFGCGLFGLANLLGDKGYSQAISLFPFITNQPIFALFVMYLPLITLIGLVTQERIRSLILFSSLFLTAAVFPFFNISATQFKNFDIATVPQPYQEYFIKPYAGIAESTYYPLQPCWQATYMNQAGIIPICLNFGLRYPSATLGDPRLVAGEQYSLAQLLAKETKILNLRVTHNLKNIIVPRDAAKEDEKEIAQKANAEFEKNPLLTRLSNENFAHYFFVDKDRYDFLLYSPLEIVQKDTSESIVDNSLDAAQRPVVVSSDSLFAKEQVQSVNVAYKISSMNPTKYYVHISADNQKPFMLQLNQVYGSSWKLKWVDKAYFDSKQCMTAWEVFPMTNNQRCQYDSKLFEIGDIELLAKPSLRDSLHSQSNFGNNSWLVKPEEVPISIRGQKDLYAVLIIEKQIYYTIAILLGIMTIVVLSFVAFAQEIKRK
ncbi:MAG: hypothetical protein AAB553_00360 [Patescibacteria group bacterium]